MATALYDHGRNHFLMGDIHWKESGDTIRATFVDLDDYTPDLANDHYMNLDTIPAGARISSTTLTLIAPTAGVANAEMAAFLSVSGDVFEALVLWKDGGGEGLTQSGTDDLLIACITSDKLPSFPITPVGSDIHIVWDTGNNKIFRL
jgi:hypothetical protein